MSEARPNVVILAGPNGAGKSTAAPELLQGALGVNEFVNADVIARGLSPFDPDSAAVGAGRVMLSRLRELAGQRVASRSRRRSQAARLRRGFAISQPRDTRSISSSSGCRPRIWRWSELPEFDVEDTTFQRKPSAAATRQAFATLSGCISRSHRPRGCTTASGRKPKLVAERLESQALRVYHEGVWAVVERKGTA